MARTFITTPPTPAGKPQRGTMNTDASAVSLGEDWEGADASTVPATNTRTPAEERHAAAVERVVNLGLLTADVAKATPIEALKVLVNTTPRGNVSLADDWEA